MNIELRWYVRPGWDGPVKILQYRVMRDVTVWQQASADHLFIPYDGDGYWATATHESRMSVWRFDKPEWATHVAWYNK